MRGRCIRTGRAPCAIDAPPPGCRSSSSGGARISVDEVRISVTASASQLHRADATAGLLVNSHRFGWSDPDQAPDGPMHLLDWQGRCRPPARRRRARRHGRALPALAAVGPAAFGHSGPRSVRWRRRARLAAARGACHDAFARRMPEAAGDAVAATSGGATFAGSS